MNPKNQALGTENASRYARFDSAVPPMRDGVSNQMLPSHRGGNESFLSFLSLRSVMKKDYLYNLVVSLSCDLVIYFYENPCL